MLGWFARRQKSPWELDGEQKAIFDFTVQDIARAALKGCNFCQWFLDTSEAYLRRPRGDYVLYAEFSLGMNDRIKFFGLLERNEKPVLQTPKGFTLYTTSGE